MGRSTKIEESQPIKEIKDIKNVNKEKEADKKVNTLNVMRNTLSIFVFIVGIISICLNVFLIKDVVKKNKTIRLNAYNYIDNLLDYEPTIITEISQVLINESVQAVEVEKNGKYTGSRVDGQKTGIGTYIWNNGNSYEGEFKNDLMHGKGKLYVVGKGTYEGEFVAGKKSGEGTFKFANGDVYIGTWLEDKMEGKGKYTFANGDVYTGEFSNNKFNGKGTYTKNGSSYTGTWKNNAYNK